MSATLAIARPSSLYEIQEHLTCLLDTLDMCESDADRQAVEVKIERTLKMELRKVDGITNYLAWLESQAQFAAEEIKRLQARKRVAENRHTRISEYVMLCMKARSYTRLEGRTSTLSLRKNPDSVEILDESQLPAEYAVVETVTKYPLDPIKKALKAGIAVPGARLVTDKKRLERK